MSLTLFLCEVEESEKGWPIWASLQKSSFALNFRQVHGAQVALLQSPILRLLRSKLKPAVPKTQKTCAVSTFTKNQNALQTILRSRRFQSRDETRKSTHKSVTPTENVLPMS